jgi:drug/metabolite transporter (DMT)-like permease
MLAGVALLSLNDGLVKSLAATYPIGELLFVRGAFVFPWIFLIAVRRGGLHTLRINNIAGQALRGGCVVASAFLFVNGLVYLPLADAIAVTFSGPLFITALAPFALGEHVGWRRWMAVLAGFAGVLFMVRPGGGALQWAVLLPLGAALCGGVRDIITRRIAATETSAAVMLVTTSVVMLAGLATAPFGWLALKSADLSTFAASGLLLAGAHYLMIEAFRRGEAALVAPFKYTSMVWAVLFGFLLFGDLPDEWTLFGAAIVIFAGLYIFRRETIRSIRPIASSAPPARM